MIFPLILGVLLGALSVVFIAQNTLLVTITFLPWQFEGSLAVILLLTILCGVVITLLFLLPTLINDTFYLSAIKKQKKEVEDELITTKLKLTEVLSNVPLLRDSSTNS